MIYTNSVMNALFLTLTSDSILVNCGVVIEKYAIENTNPNNTPYWVNLLDPEIEISGRRANINQPWMAEYTIPIVIQTQNYLNVEQQFESMECLLNLADNVWSAVNCNRTLNNNVNIITGFNKAPLDRDVIQSDVFLMRQMNIIAEVFA